MEQYNNPSIKMGFWPGGDRDGNPSVTVDITLKVASALRSSIIKCYYLEVRRLNRRLTFKGVESILADLESKLYNNIFIPGSRTQLSREEILHALMQIREIIIYQHNGLFLHLVDKLVHKVQVLGVHVSSLYLLHESYI